MEYQWSSATIFCQWAQALAVPASRWARHDRRISEAWLTARESLRACKFAFPKGLVFQRQARRQREGIVWRAKIMQGEKTSVSRPRQEYLEASEGKETPPDQAGRQAGSRPCHATPPPPVAFRPVAPSATGAPRARFTEAIPAGNIQRTRPATRTATARSLLPAPVLSFQGSGTRNKSQRVSMTMTYKYYVQMIIIPNNFYILF
jgi:hypothetical protein